MAEKLKLDIDPAWASFQAKHLHALEPIIRSGECRIEHWWISGLIIEPIATGGAVLVATDGGTLAAIFDPTANASRPMRITISDDLFSAVTPPAGVKMYAPGDPFTVPLPEWAQPGSVYVYALAAMVIGQMPHPADEGKDTVLASVKAERGNSYEGGYRIHKELPSLNWRGPLSKPRIDTLGRVNLYPHIMGRFDRVQALFCQGLEMSFGGPEDAVILTAPGGPFVGAIMPNRFPLEHPALPTWASLPELSASTSYPSAA